MQCSKYCQIVKYISWFPQIQSHLTMSSKSFIWKKQMLMIFIYFLGHGVAIMMSLSGLLHGCIRQQEMKLIWPRQNNIMANLDLRAKQECFHGMRNPSASMLCWQIWQENKNTKILSNPSVIMQCLVKKDPYKACCTTWNGGLYDMPQMQHSSVYRSVHLLHIICKYHIIATDILQIICSRCTDL